MGTRTALLAALVLVSGLRAAQEPEPLPLPREAKQKPEPFPLPREAKAKQEPEPFPLPREAKAKEGPEQLPVPREIAGKETLPAPRVLGPMPFFPYAPPDPPPQFGRRDVWQYFSVNNRGQFVPRVVYSPHGAYYLYNGRPFPYTTTQPLLWDKNISD
jgi:hypothetical protein